MGKNHKRKQQARERKEEEGHLNRFAGSSDENDNNNDNGVGVLDSSADDASVEGRGDPDQVRGEEAEGDTLNKEAGDDDSSEEDSEDDEAEPTVLSGMASAMSKILSTTTKTGTASVILSKTTTPLQRMAKDEKEKEDARREKRRMNRERNLASLHIPLSVATSRQSGGGSSSTSLVKELEMERVHRRFATRGVVALFNAIAQHQKKVESQAGPSVITKSKTDVKQLTKHGFLDMIKSTAAKRALEGSQTTSGLTGKDVQEQSTEETKKPVKPQWSALQDDYMLNSKLKDWDKESSDDDEDTKIHDDDLSDDGGEPVGPSKKQRISLREE